MVPAVARHFMTGFGNAADESGIALGDPAKREECRLDVSLFEQRQHGVAVAFDAVGQAVPVVARDHRFEGADLEPVLDVDRKRIQHRSEEHTSELQSLMRISYAVFCLKKKTTCK